ncbi:MAG: ATP-binding domain-containing protein [Chloroflexi bacterium]|nr:ATP-binding domain-containing protein [Chloroflexota bacterium]
MLAHAIGLGIYNPDGDCVQMLGRRESWEAIGYEVTGILEKGNKVEIFRPAENSPNRISEIYTGTQHLIVARSFDDRESELAWIADSIRRDVRDEGVAPEKIVVISLNPRRDVVRSNLSNLQSRLLEFAIPSTIPGVLNSSDAFAEPGYVTLTTVFRAKGNEADVIYVMNFEFLYDFVDEPGIRNQAFAAISRSKAWVRITGIGKKMEVATKEINNILGDQPYFRFVFPDMNEIQRRLDAGTKKRRREKADAASALTKLRNLNKRAILAAMEEDPSSVKELKKLMDELDDEP